LEPVGAERVEVAKVPNNENIVVKQSPVLRKKYTQLSKRKQKMIRNAVKQRVEDHWAQISPLYPEELGRCLEEMNYITQKSSESDTLVNAYKLAHEKNDEERKTVPLSVFILQENMSKGKLSQIVGMEVSSRKFTSAKYHAILYGPGQSAIAVVHKRGAAVKRSIIKKFVKFLIERVS
jgi:hypothetical protein